MKRFDWSKIALTHKKIGRTLVEKPIPSVVCPVVAVWHGFFQIRWIGIWLFWFLQRSEESVTKNLVSDLMAREETVTRVKTPQQDDAVLLEICDTKLERIQGGAEWH